jgi:hypothetical protein
MTRQYIGCTVKQLPHTAHVDAARTAVRINPANAPLVHPSLAPLPPEHLALLTSKYWGTGGVKLTVSFMDGPDAETRRKILAAANAWGTRANVSFVQTAGIGQVRITRDQSGYWSYLGTDILSIPTGEATMNLQGFTANTPDSEYRRVVPHEFGHTLAFPHEHERPEIIRRLDREKTIALFMSTQGWSRDAVIQQVLTPPPGIDPRSLPPDVRSIMCYEFPASITLDGQPIPGGTDINDEDYRLAALIYPKDTGGGGNPDPPATSSGPILVRARLPVGWYTLYPGPPRGKTSVLQVIGEVKPGQYQLAAAARQGGLGWRLGDAELGRAGAVEVEGEQDG